MANVLEPATSGRAKCRGCDQAIARGDLRFGEHFPNPFGEGDMTLWFHPMCAAYKRPESLLQTLTETNPKPPDHEALARAANASLAHRRRSRIDGAERAPSSQAKCRHCREAIEKNTWRIRVEFFEEGRFSPGGFIHLACRGEYFETDDVLDQVLHFSANLSADDRKELKRAFSKS